MTMRYTKGKRGPETTHDVAIFHLKQEGTPDKPLVKGVMSVTLKSGTRMVSLLAQGKNAKALLADHKDRGDNLRLTMRWTARESVTVTGIEAPAIDKAA